MISNYSEKEIGIIGYGRFGRLLATILSKDFSIFCYDPRCALQEPSGRVVMTTLEKAASRESVFFCVPISKFEDAVKQSIPFIKPTTTVIDVCSVKKYPARVFQKLLPAEVAYLPAHPMFGPDAAKKGLQGLPFVLCSSDEKKRNTTQLEYWANYLSERQFKVVKMTCEEHDKTAAYSLCVTQLLGRVLSQLEIEASEIDTQSFKDLLRMKNIAENDAWEMFVGLQTYNPYAKEMREKLIDSLGGILQLLDKQDNLLS